MCDNKCPWLGFKPYSEDDASFFNGRSTAINSLLEIVEAKTITVCYAESGVGKTSLINAGLLPNLREKNFLPIWVRFDVKKFEGKAIEAVKELFCNNILTALHAAKDDFETKYPSCKIIWEIPDENQKVTLLDLWKALRGVPKAEVSFKGLEYHDDYKPFLILDQFEQVLYDSNSQIIIESFFEVLKSLVLNDTFGDEYLRMKELGLVRKDNEDLFKVLVSLRQEYIGVLDYWCMNRVPMPSLHDNRYSLQPLTTQEAREIILPNGCDIFEEAVGQIIEIAKENNGVSSILLSVVCRRLYEQAPSTDGKKTKVIGVDVEKVKGTIIKDYYDEQLENAKKEAAQKGHESFLSEEIISQIEDALVSDDGKRYLLAIMNNRLQGIVFPESIKLILENNGIIRSDRIGKNTFVELIHDKVADAVLERKKERKEKEKEQKIEEQRRLANLKKYKAKHNILTLAGRQLMDNCGFDFSEDNSRTITSGNSKNQLKKNISNIHSREYDGSDNVFIADMLNQIVGDERLCIHFGGSPTKDGYEALEIHTQLLNSQRLINGLIFYGSIACDSPICSAEGFNGVNIEYDSEGNEIARIYIHSKDGVNVSGVSRYEIAEYDDYGFPRKILFKDEKNNPCKHFDGNYGIEFTYDIYGNEQFRRYLDKDGKNTCKIYNQVCGMKSEYDDRDRVVLQYFVDEKEEITDDVYGHVGVKYFYDKETGDKIRTECIGKDRKTCLSPYGYSIVTFHYKNGKLFQLRHYGSDGKTPANRIDGDFRYSILEIVGYDKCDRILGYILRDTEEKLILKLLYTYDNKGRMTDIKYYAGEDICSIGPTGVHHTKYEYYENGLLKSQSHFGVNGSAVEDINGIHRVNFEYDEHGRIAQRHFFKPNEDKYNSTFYEYKSDAQCIVRDRTYIDAEGNYLEEKQEWIINHKLQAKEVISGENNSFIPGCSVRVKFKYNISGDVIEQRFFDVESDKPIADEDGDYGIRIESDNVKEESRTLLLDENGNCSKNKHPYAIIDRKNMKFNGDECVCESYFEEDRTPVLCESGYHKMITSHPVDGDELNRKVFLFDCQDNPCNCKDGYSKQIFKEEISSTERKRTVYFLGADGAPVINNARGFHKREQIISVEKGIETNRSFTDENDHLINVPGGFAKRTCKRYDSFWSLFHFPFEYYDVIRFYDENDQKVDLDYEIKIKGRAKTFYAHEFIAPLDHDSSFLEVNAMSGKNLYRDWTKMWKFVFVILVPLFIIVGFPIYYLNPFFRKLFNIIRPKQEKTLPIIWISEVFDEVPKGKAQTGNEALISPAKTMGIKRGCWVIGWNDWLYNKHDANIVDMFREMFEKEVNISGSLKVITLYDPKEQIFFNLSIKAANIGVRIQDTQVPEKLVDEMEEKARLLSADENVYLLRTIYLYLAQQYKENGEYIKAAEYYRKQLALMEKQGEEVSPHALADAYKNLGVCLSCDNKNGEAIEMLELALEILKEREEEKQLIAEIHNHLAQVFRVGGESEKANFHNDRYVDLKKLV